MVKQCVLVSASWPSNTIRTTAITDDYFSFFDKSLNVKTRTTQRDFYVRLWEGDSVVSRYFYSQFFRHATTVNLKEGFEKSAYELPKAQLLQITSMDGPNVNWS